jgi:DNA-binding response OmpR family regulator
MLCTASLNHPPAQDALDKDMQSFPSSAGDGGAAAPRTVLVVDDNRSVASALGRLMREAGFEPLVFNRGIDALEHTEQTTGATVPAAAVIDIHLPDLNGLVLSQKLRERFRPGAPIIVLSGDTSSETLRTLPHVGATYFFSKPVNGRNLFGQLKRLLDEEAPSEQSDSGDSD